MVRARQDEVARERLVARFSLRSFMPHVVLGWASVALPATGLGAAYGMWALAVGGVALASLVLAAGVSVLARIELVVDHEALRLPAAALAVPWADVESLSLVGSPSGIATLRLGVRDGRALAARQLPASGIWRIPRRRLANSGVLELPLGWLDHSSSEIFEAAVAHCPTAGRGNPQAVERRMTTTRRAVIALAITLVVLQLITVAGWVVL
jgi:hypothetical protein